MSDNSAHSNDYLWRVPWAIEDEFGYPPVERDEVYIEIFEKAENFKKNNKSKEKIIF